MHVLPYHMMRADQQGASVSELLRGQTDVNVVACYDRNEEAAMRWVYLTVVILFGAATIIFIVQNLETVTMAFLGASIRAPLAVLGAVAYVLGAVTGGSLFALLRKSVQGSRASGL